MATGPAPHYTTEWKAQYREIRNELLELLVSKTVFRRMIRIIERKRSLAQYGVVYGAIRVAYATYGALAVRRTADSRHGTRSLYKLLQQIANHPTEISRIWFVSEWNPELRHVAEKNFDRLAGRRKQHLTKRMVLADLKRLRDKTATIVDWANDYVAHRAAHPTATASFRDLRIAIENVIRLSNKYGELLVESKAMMPIIPEPWESVFYVPWLKPRKRRIKKELTGQMAAKNIVR